MIRALAITVSNRASTGIYADRSGPVLAELLRNAGCEVDEPQVIADGDPVEAALRDAVQAGYDVVVTAGGTGRADPDRQSARFPWRGQGRHSGAVRGARPRR